MENIKTTQNIFSHLTAKERENLSFPAKILLNKNLLKGDVLDFGCGFGKDVEILSAKGINIDAYDKFYFPNYPQKRYDTIICFYVLNVLLPEEQAMVLMQLSELIKPSGKVFIAVRRDVNFEGYRTHRVHQKKTYQCNVVLNATSIYRNDHCEIYQYQHFNQLKRNVHETCPFCNPEPERELIVESGTAYSMYDKYPVNPGHALIIPKRHCDDFFSLSFKEQSACLLMLNVVKQKISERFNPDGFNVGINVGEKAGQTIHHVHIHLIPRYQGDVDNPTGGVRSVIPDRREY